MNKHVSNFIKEYFTNPFIIWGLFVIITDITKSIPQIFELREFIWINLIHVIIFWMMAIYVICNIHAPLLDNLKKLSRVNIGLAYFTIVGFVMIIATEGVFFFIGIMELIAGQHHEIIIDQTKYDENIKISFIIAYFLLPIATHKFVNDARKELTKRYSEITKKLKDYPVEITIIMTLTFVFSSIYVILMNNNII